MSVWLLPLLHDNEKPQMAFSQGGIKKEKEALEERKNGALQI